MATPVYDLITNTSLGLQSVSNAANQKERHRELVTAVKPNATTNFLKFVDTQFTWYNIPLGEAPTRKKDQPSKHNNVLVPIIPLCYTSPDCDPKNAKSPRQGGYLYLYIGDYLWRELEVLKDGKFRDVNLHQYQGKDHRPATVEMDTRILVPHMVDGNVNTISICYSEIQWSWARINSLGGMDPKDFRLDDENPPPLASDQNISKATAAQNRTARMQELDLSGCRSGFPMTVPAANNARIENVGEATSNLYYLKLHRKSEIPVVYLHDPLGVAKANLGKLLGVKSELAKIIHQVSSGEYYKSAVLAYHTFFNEKLIAKNKAFSPRDDVNTNDYVDESTPADNLRNAKAEIDLTFLKKELKVEVRKQIRKAVRQLKVTHVEFMDGKFKEKNIKDTNSDFVSVNEALKDYAELEAPEYSLLWSVYMDLINIMPFDPAILDKALDLKADHDQLMRHEDLGHIYLKSILESTHPLHAMLFPSNAQVDEYSKKYKVDLQATEKLDGSGKFRPVAFAKTFKITQLKGRYSQKSDLPLNLLANTIGDLTLLMAGQVYAPKSFFYQKPNTATINPVIRLSIALNDPELESLHMVKKGADLNGLFILDGRFTILEKLRRGDSQPTKFANATNNPGTASGKVNVIDPKTSKAIASTQLSQIKNNKGLPLDLSNKNWNSLFVKTSNADAQQSSGTTTADVLVVGAFSKLAGKILEGVKKASGASGGKMTLSSVADFSNKKLPSLLLVFEVINLYSVYAAVNKSKTMEEKFKNITKFSLATTALPFSIVEASTKLLGAEKTANGLAKILGAERAKNLIFRDVKKVGFRSFSLLTKTGIGFSGAGAIMSGWDMIDAMLDDDDDAAVAYGVQMVAGIGLALSGLGAGLAAGGASTGFLVALGPWGWAFLGVIIIAGILAAWFADSEIEKWAKHGPFAALEDRMSKNYLNKTPQFAHQALLALLMAPQIKITDKKDTAILVVEAFAPGFESGKSTLTIDTLVSNGEIHRTGAPVIDKKQSPLNLIGWSPLLDKKLPSLTLGMRYIYQRPKNYSGELKKIFSRVQHITKDSNIIPMKASNHNTKKADPTFIDDKVNGWAYAKPIIISE